MSRARTEAPRDFNCTVHGCSLSPDRLCPFHLLTPLLLMPAHRLWSGVTGRLNINSCAYTRAGDKPNISLRSTTNVVAPLNGPWQCIG